MIEGPLRSLWVVGVALIAWSFAMRYADRNGTQERTEEDFGMRDAVVMGLTQCLALIPGVSRSGATITAGLLRGLDRMTVTRMSFFLAIPALTAAAILEAVTKADEISAGVGWGPTAVAVVVAFVVALRLDRVAAALRRPPRLRDLRLLPDRARGPGPRAGRDRRHERDLRPRKRARGTPGQERGGPRAARERNLVGADSRRAGRPQGEETENLRVKNL